MVVVVCVSGGGAGCGVVVGCVGRLGKGRGGVALGGVRCNCGVCA